MGIKSTDLDKIGFVLKGGVLVKDKATKNKIIRVKESIGNYKFNKGVYEEIVEEKYILDKNRWFYAFDIVPIGKPRMTQSDKWKTNPNHPNPLQRKREVVHKYHLTQNEIRKQANEIGFTLGQTLEAVFFIPMPESWSQSKKDKLVGMPCKEKPDIDNIIKFLLDTFSKEDKSVWKTNCEKRWAYYGSIIIFK